jgi:very-short-patch-repair endonuclease/nucleoside 2-deoxyribosyltransferase
MDLKIYAAGKISSSDWRSTFIKGINNSKLNIKSSDDWPILNKAVFDRLDYVGPYFTNCNHCCELIDICHEDNIDNNYDFVSKDHNICSFNKHAGDLEDSRNIIFNRCKLAIDKCDIFLVYINSLDCYGTISEIGYAYSKSKKIFIVFSENFDDLWFIKKMSNYFTILKEGETLAQIFEKILTTYNCLPPIFNSPMEEKYWGKIIKFIPNIKCQYPIGPFFADFAVVDVKGVIEIDGHEFHKTPEQRTNDASRQRYLEMNGWRVTRFTGTEVSRNIDMCINESLKVLKEWKNNQAVK